MKVKLFLKSIFVLVIIVIILLNNYINNINSELSKNPYTLINKLKMNINQNISIRSKDNSICDNIDPISIFNLRFKNEPLTFCETKASKHVCYRNNNGYKMIFFIHILV